MKASGRVVERSGEEGRIMKESDYDSLKLND